MHNKLFNMHDFSKVIGRRIRYYRQNKGITITELSYMVDVEYCHLSNIEFGKVNASVLNVLKISKALEVCISNLLNSEILEN